MSSAIAPPRFYVGSAPEKAAGVVRIVVVSETLGLDQRIPPCDIFIHAGNYTSRSGAGVEKFSRFLRDVGAYKVVVSGRNEVGGGSRPTGAINLEGATTLVCGLRICSATVFNEPKPWQHEGVVTNDIVISSVPPYGVLDVDEGGKHVGSAELRHCLETKPPRVIVFGGNPCGHGAMWLCGPGTTLCVNAGMWGYTTPMTKYGVPLIVDLPAKK